ncbi:MAG: Uma2 family endonuclease [Bacteroidota bacterium]
MTGDLIAEGDTRFAGNQRRPDLAYYTDEQIQQARNGKDVMPSFVLEVISTFDQINRVQRKMQDYRKANVKVVWQIFPELKEVHIYRGKQMQICEDNDICSAEEVIEGFELSVNDLFV